MQQQILFKEVPTVELFAEHKNWSLNIVDKILDKI